MTYSTALITVITCVVLLVVLLLWAISQRKKSRLKKQALGISWLRSLRQLLMHSQQHRGMSTGFLNGEQSLFDKIIEIQRSIGRDIIAIEAFDSQVKSNGQWQAITQHWAKLSGTFKKNTRSNNIDQHSKLIQNILFFIDDKACQHDLLLLESPSGIPLHFAWRELLTAAECIGQARALGTGVVAAACCDTVSRIRLNYLCQKIELTTQAAWHEIPPSDEQRRNVSFLLSCIQDDILGESLTIDVNTYFTIASQAIDGLHQQYDTMVDQLHSNRL